MTRLPAGRGKAAQTARPQRGFNVAMNEEVGDLIRVGPVRTMSREAESRRELDLPRVLRIVLPLTAAALVVAVFFPRIGGGGQPKYTLSADVAALSTGTRVENPRLTGITADGAAYVFRAEVARPDGATPDKIELEGVRGNVDMPNERVLTLKADTGRFVQSEKNFRLSAVTLTTSDGYTAQTDVLTANSDARTIRSDSRVVGYGPAGRFCAERMELIEGEGGVARFIGDVVVILTDLPGAADAREDEALDLGTPTNEDFPAAPRTRPREGAELTVCQQTLWALDEAE